MSTRSSTITPGWPTRKIQPDETGATAAGVLTRAAKYFAQHGIDHIERVISDNAFAYRTSKLFKDAVADLGAVQKFIKPHCPWQNGKIERFNWTLAVEWAYRHKYTSNNHRADALAPWPKLFNTERTHTANGAPPISRLPTTS